MRRDIPTKLPAKTEAHMQDRMSKRMSEACKYCQKRRTPGQRSGARREEGREKPLRSRTSVEVEKEEQREKERNKKVKKENKQAKQKRDKALKHNTSKRAKRQETKEARQALHFVRCRPSGQVRAPTKTNFESRYRSEILIGTYYRYAFGIWAHAKHAGNMVGEEASAFLSGRAALTLAKPRGPRRAQFCHC